MELSEAKPLLEENHMAVVSTLTPSGEVQATVVSAGLLDGKVVFASPSHTVKVRNLLRTGRCTVTVIKPETRRYVTVEGSVAVQDWKDAGPEKQIALLRTVYAASGRPPERWDDFDAAMHEERRAVIFVTPERIYGSLVRGQSR